MGHPEINFVDKYKSSELYSKTRGIASTENNTPMDPHLVAKMPVPFTGQVLYILFRQV